MQHTPTSANDLDYPLLKLLEKEEGLWTVMPSYQDELKRRWKPQDPGDTWTLRDAVQGVQIFGGIGSGKSSGSGKTLACTYLKHGYGGVVFTGKMDETWRWLEYAKRTEQLHRIVIFSPHPEKYEKDYPTVTKGNYRFDPLQYQRKFNTQSGTQQEATHLNDNIVSLFMSLAKMRNRMDGGGDASGRDPFWNMATERCLRNAINLLDLAKKGLELFTINNPGHAEIKTDSLAFELTMLNISKVIRESPIGTGLLNKLNTLGHSTEKKEHVIFQKWAKGSFCVYALSWAQYYAEHADLSSDEKQEIYDLLEVVKGYFLSEFARLAEKTRSSIIEFFFAFGSPFLAGLLARYFTGDISSEILPEETLKGKVIILDFPVKEYLQLGVYAQTIYKRLWQQTVERREIQDNDDSVPVFMWIDESQYLINEYDMLFQTTARSSKACTVLITQNISNYYATIGGQDAKAQVDSLLGNLTTKIFHANIDYVTNDWAANSIGKVFQNQESYSSDDFNISEIERYLVAPYTFTTLERGGNETRLVTAIMTGKKFDDGKNYKVVAFEQEGSD